ncbi:MAG: DUF4198 domain-containing protein [Pseudomonadota bacterium]
MRVSLVLITLASVAMVLSTHARAHEFWIEPVAYEVAPGAPLIAHIRVGEEFKGPSSTFLPRSFTAFFVNTPLGRVAVESNLGDTPVLDQRVPADGLATIVYVTGNSTLTYPDLAKFERFLTHKDALWVLDQHAARGLPEEKFREIYSRYAKSLVNLGPDGGQDSPFGLVTEIVAEANPYTDDLSTGFPIQVLYEGAPRSEAQVEVFEKSPGGSVDVTLTRTDSDGRVRIPVKPGHSYLLDAVVLREPPAALAEARDVVWESLWASLTFGVPD